MWTVIPPLINPSGNKSTAYIEHSPWLFCVISCRYDIKSTETVFDNATRSRIVSPETTSSHFILWGMFGLFGLCFACARVWFDHLDYAVFASRWPKLFHALPADILAKPLVRSNFCCCFILLTVDMHAVGQISCCLCPYAITLKTERIHDAVFHLFFVS